MKYVRLSSLWGLTLIACSLVASSVSSLGFSAETHIGESLIYPVIRFYRGSLHASVTESTLERIFSDRLIGVTNRGEVSKRLATHVYDLCVQFRMDPAFVLSVIQAESSFRTDAVSSAGAIGLMQIMPATARVVAGRNPKVFGGKSKAKIEPRDLRDPFLNVSLGIVYLSELRKRYRGLSPYYHLAAYNLGPHRLDTLRARPNFRPQQTWKYYEDIMRGVGDWRHYRSAEELAVSKLSTIQIKRSRLRPVSDVARKPITRKI